LLSKSIRICLALLVPLLAMPKVQIKLDLKPHQLKAASSPAKTKYYQGGVRSGKTHVAASEIFRVCNNYPKTRGFVGRKDFTSLRESALVTYLDLIPAEMRQYNDQKHIITLKTNGSQIIFAELKDWRKYGSWELGCCHLVEVMEIPKQCYEMLDTRLSQKSVPYEERKMILDSNPVHQYHWAYKLRQERKADPSFYFQIFTTYDMIDILGEQYIRDQEKKGERFVQIMLRGETGFLAEGDPAFKGFSERIHISKEFLHPVNSVPLLMDWDFGFDCPAVNFFQKDYRDRIVNYATLVGLDISTEDFATDVTDFSRDTFKRVPHWVAVDPAGKAQLSASDTTDIEILRNKGFEVVFIPSTPRQRHAIIRHKLATEQILINSENCQELIEAFMGGYCLKKEPKDEDDIKDPNHPYKDVMDAFGYGLMCCGVPLVDKPRSEPRVSLSKAPPLSRVINPYARMG